ncbi:MAG: hypothetical protein NZ802_10730, partial [Candidatus Poseidoniales archaeon]|nr:hypothetical protein [Candidatus Poseidoniales archaeon]
MLTEDLRDHDDVNPILTQPFERPSQQSVSAFHSGAVEVDHGDVLERRYPDCNLIIGRSGLRDEGSGIIWIECILNSNRD